MWELTQLIVQTVTLTAVLVIFVEYVTLRRRTTHATSLLRIAARKMECDDLIDQLLAPNTQPEK